MNQVVAAPKANRPLTVIWAVGGIGAQVCAELIKNLQPAADNYRIYYIDTAMSDIPENTSPDHIYLVPKANGCGQDRRLAHQYFSPEIPKIVGKFAPGTMNIVVYSTHGGTGSTAGVMLLKHFATNKISACAVVMASRTTTTSCTNTIHTVTQMDKDIRKTGFSYPVFIDEIRPDVKISTTINNLAKAVDNLVTLNNGNHRRIDIQDIRNFLNIGAVRDMSNQLMTMSIETDVSKVPSGAVSMMVLQTNQDNDIPNVPNAAYLSVGTMQEDDAARYGNKDIVIYLDIDGYGRLVDTVSVYQENVARSASQQQLIGNSLADLVDGDDDFLM